MDFTMLWFCKVLISVRFDFAKFQFYKVMFCTLRICQRFVFSHLCFVDLCFGILWFTKVLLVPNIYMVLQSNDAFPKQLICRVCILQTVDIANFRFCNFVSLKSFNFVKFWSCKVSLAVIFDFEKLSFCEILFLEFWICKILICWFRSCKVLISQRFDIESCGLWKIQIFSQVLNLRCSLAAKFWSCRLERSWKVKRMRSRQILLVNVYVSRTVNSCMASRVSILRSIWLDPKVIRHIHSRLSLTSLWHTHTLP